ncbi:hypothetical protein Aab01nite_63630 [Paractinoplanes abujensis]|uniref:Uncharacterized protein n=1 Tax=Paractinoplanes abujensis TaxID=882441 RepID=A0A7W7CQ82_9ACTN|nr:hypothetical protein [Actinoplanes abujensis]MBB4692727.1 hypothetical protein [Actinoplanes abujensis]GID22773.1 hypothetical protein Aab01nite_63630 [Actinoplanes abujensis]
MQLTEMSELGFRTSVSVFQRPAGGLRWVIIPTIHMGHADYYWAIWQRLRSCSAVIAEIWDGPSSTGMTYANAMRLARQRAARDLVPQDIDYRALGVPIIFPDAFLAPDADPERRMSVEEQVLAHLSTPFLAWHMARAGDWLATQVDWKNLHDHTVVPRDELDVQREDELLHVMHEIDTEFAAEDAEVAVVFGALHIPIVVRDLARLGHRERPGTQWLTAIDYDEPAILRKPSLDGWMDW